MENFFIAKTKTGLDPKDVINVDFLSEGEKVGVITEYNPEDGTIKITIFIFF